MSSGAQARNAAAPAAVSGGVINRRGLFEQLRAAARVTEVSAPAGGGKTVLLRSWVGDAGLADRAGWVTVQRADRDPQRFWVSVADALRGTAAGSALVRPVSAPDLDGWAVVEWLLKDLAALSERIWLVIDDVHELRPGDALPQLELLVMRAPPELRFVLATRDHVGLGLHRLRLEGELTEIRAGDLKFTRDEARALLDDAGVELTEPSLALLCERTEGWAAGLRLAALSLAGREEPEQFVAEFSGSERTVAEYLIAEVLKRQPRHVRRLLLRTSVLDRINGELADLLTGRRDGGRILRDLEEAGAFVVALDAQRTWFRYHRLFSDLLQFELRTTAPHEIPALHAAAAGWLTDHGFPIEAVRHAQAAGDWELAAHVLVDHWLGLALHGRAATGRELLAGFPADLVTADAELTTLLAASELGWGSLEEAERHLQKAAAESASVPADRRADFQVLLAVERLRLALQRNDLSAIVAEGQQILAWPVADAAQHGRAADARAMALVSVGTAEVLSQRLDEAEQHLEQGIALARLRRRPLIEIHALAYGAEAARYRSHALAVQRGRQAIELGRRHGWTEQPIMAVAYTATAAALVWQGQLDEGQQWLREAERTLRAEFEPVIRLLLQQTHGALELAHGRYAAARASFQAARKQTEPLGAPHAIHAQTRALLLHALLRAGDIHSAGQALSEMDRQQRESPEVRAAEAALQLARDDWQAALRVLAPLVDGSAPASNSVRAEAFLLEAIARDAAGDPAAAENALERALDLAQQDSVLLPFVIHPTPELLERHSRHCTTHAALIREILTLLALARPAGLVSGPQWPADSRSPQSTKVPADRPAWSSAPWLEPLREAEMRVLRYLPTNLTVPEIASELYLSRHTVKTHIRHLYTKLDAHGRTEAVQRARELDLLAPSPHRD